MNRIGIYHSLETQIIINYENVIQIFLKKALFVAKGIEKYLDEFKLNNRSFTVAYLSYAVALNSLNCEQ